MQHPKSVRSLRAGAARYRSLFMRQHASHAAGVYVVVRLMVTMAIAWSADARGSAQPGGAVALEQEVMGPVIALFMVTLATAVAALDRRRMGSTILMQNLGVSTGESVLVSAVPAVAGEAVLHLLVLMA